MIITISVLWYFEMSYKLHLMFIRARREYDVMATEKQSMEQQRVKWAEEENKTLDNVFHRHDVSTGKPLKTELLQILHFKKLMWIQWRTVMAWWLSHYKAWLVIQWSRVRGLVRSNSEVVGLSLSCFTFFMEMMHSISVSSWKVAKIVAKNIRIVSTGWTIQEQS